MKNFRLLLIITMVALCAASGIYALQATWPVGVPLRGAVVLPDGSPAVGATVRIESICGPNHLVRIVETDKTGSFHGSSFSPDCREYKFNADLKRGMWLPTGNNIFYVKPNGTSPVLRLKSGTTPEAVTIRFQERGGEADLRVRDNATGAYLEAGISMRRIDGLGSVSFVVSTEGSIDLLPPGRYRVEVDRYMCRTKHIWLVRKPRLDFEVIPGERHPVVVSLDTRTTKVRSSYDNLRADRCTP